MTVSVLWLFLTVNSVVLQCVIVIFLDRTHFLVGFSFVSCNRSYSSFAIILMGKI